MSESHDIGELVSQHRLLKAKQVTTEVGLRIRPDVLDQADAMPAITYETTNTDNWHGLGGASGAAQTRLLVRCYGATRRQANRVAAIVEDLLDGMGGLYLGPNNEVWVSDCVLENAWDLRDDPTSGSSEYRYLRNLDFLISHTKPTPSLSPTL